MLYGMWLSYEHLLYRMLPKSVCILLQVIFLKSCYCCIIIMWNQIGLLHWQWIPKSMRVLSVPVNHRHWGCSYKIVAHVSEPFMHLLLAEFVPSVFSSVFFLVIIKGDSLARGPKLLSIKNYVIEIMTWKFTYTYQERCKTGPAHNRCWNWSPFTSKHTWMRFSKFWNTFPKVLMLTAWISWLIVPLGCSIVWGVFLYTLPFNRPQRKMSAGFPLSLTF